jgi:hypothetical protein
MKVQELAQKLFPFRCIPPITEAEKTPGPEPEPKQQYTQYTVFRSVNSAVRKSTSVPAQSVC